MTNTAEILNIEDYKPERVYFSEIMTSKVILSTGVYNGFNYEVVSYGTHPCCYIDLPKGHRWYKKDYKDIDVKCHWGLTYSYKNGNFWRIGWDYAHCEDYMTYYKDLYVDNPLVHLKKWTLPELIQECKEVCEQC